jgi:hypothetical protein
LTVVCLIEELAPQELVANTDKTPEAGKLLPVLTLIILLPCPELIVNPDGSDHV